MGASSCLAVKAARQFVVSLDIMTPPNILNLFRGSVYDGLKPPTNSTA